MEQRLALPPKPTPGRSLWWGLLGGLVICLVGIVLGMLDWPTLTPPWKGLLGLFGVMGQALFLMVALNLLKEWFVYRELSQQLHGEDSGLPPADNPSTLWLDQSLSDFDRTPGNQRRSLKERAQFLHNLVNNEIQHLHHRWRFPFTIACLGPFLGCYLESIWLWRTELGALTHASLYLVFLGSGQTLLLAVAGWWLQGCWIHLLDLWKGRRMENARPEDSNRDYRVPPIESWSNLPDPSTNSEQECIPLPDVPDGTPPPIPDDLLEPEPIARPDWAAPSVPPLEVPSQPPSYGTEPPTQPEPYGSIPLNSEGLPLESSNPADSQPPEPPTEVDSLGPRTQAPGESSPFEPPTAVDSLLPIPQPGEPGQPGNPPPQPQNPQPPGASTRTPPTEKLSTPPTQLPQDAPGPEENSVPTLPLEDKQQ